MKKFDHKNGFLSVFSNVKLIKNIIKLALPFVLMDLFIRMLTRDVNYSMPAILLPTVLYTIMWVSAIVSVSMLLGPKSGRVFYAVTVSLFYIMFLAHSVYFPYSGFFFSFNMLESAKEGGAYVWDTILQSGIWTYFTCILVLVLSIFAVVRFPKAEKIRWKAIIIIIALFLVLQAIIPFFLGKKNHSLEWDNWRNPRNVFDSFSDSNKNIKICGLFEYTVRDFYVSFLRPKDRANPEEAEFLAQAYENMTEHKANAYTGIFEGKNVIFLQLEGVDSWLLNETDMPNLYSMLDNSIVFDNHYSYYTGAGSTFNSELAVVTGFLTPVSFSRNPYSFHNNAFPASLPNQLKKQGYTANAFHMNTGEYYTRRLNYENWGFDYYYSLIDDSCYDDVTCQLDRKLIEDPFFYDMMFCQAQPFLNYIITYSVHTPFSADSKLGKLLTDEIYGEEAEVPDISEEQAARMFATETDRMVGLLLEALKENGLYDNTVIVAYADHYLYTLNDKTILDTYKTTDNNLINNTPFIIWSSDIENQHITKVNSQLDILPTVLNMLGVPFYDEYYIGSDIMSDEFGGFVFFSDYSWYDGENYAELGNVTNNDITDAEYINAMNDHINRLIRINDLTLKYNYFVEVDSTETEYTQ